MPFLQHSSVMLSFPRRPAITMRSFLPSRTVVELLAGYREPASRTDLRFRSRPLLRVTMSQNPLLLNHPFCPIGADREQLNKDTRYL